MAQNSGVPVPSNEASPALRLRSVEKVQVVLLVHEGTFASMSNLAIAGKDFLGFAVRLASNASAILAGRTPFFGGESVPQNG